MKRTGFKRPTIDSLREKARALRALTVSPVEGKYLFDAVTLKPLRMGVYARSNDDAAPIGKHVYVRSPDLLERVGQLRFCTFCCCTKSVVPCHSNFQMGKGLGIKADDYCAAGCRECHYELDQGKNWSYEEKKARFYSALARTVLMLQARGDWPRGVPLPVIPDGALA